MDFFRFLDSLALMRFCSRRSLRLLFSRLLYVWAGSGAAALPLEVTGTDVVLVGVGCVPFVEEVCGCDCNLLLGSHDVGEGPTAGVGVVVARAPSDPETVVLAIVEGSWLLEMTAATVPSTTLSTTAAATAAAVSAESSARSTA